MLPLARFAFPLPACLLVAVLLNAAQLSAVAGGPATEVRTWTSYEGTVLQASYVSSDDKTVTLDRKDGSKLVTIPISRLEFEDQAFIAGIVALRDTATSVAAWPTESMPAAYEIAKSDSRHYRSKHFEFIGDLDMTDEYIFEACRLFEGTLAAVRALPLDLRARQPEGWERFAATVTDRTTFEGIASKSIDVHPSVRIQGAFLTEHQQILIPIDAFAGRTGKAATGAAANSDVHSLIHEITQQVTDNMALLTPFWFSEGLAEYIALVPSSGNRFRFYEAETGLKHVLKEQYLTDSPEITHPADVMDIENLKNWSNDIDDQRSATLLIYYLIHLNGDQDGESMARAIRAMRATNDRGWELIDEYNEAIEEFVPRRDAYRIAVEEFKKAAAAYNKRLADAKAGKPVLLEKGENGRVVVGSGPASRPTPPPQLQVPAILRHRREAKPLEVSHFGYGFALEAMLRGRSYDQLAEDMKAAYQAIGIAITIRDPKTAP